MTTFEHNLAVIFLSVILILVFIIVLFFSLCHFKELVVVAVEVFLVYLELFAALQRQ